MSNISLDKAKQFEALVVKCLINKYGKILPKNKIELLNSTNFLTEEMLNNITSKEELQGVIVRAVFRGILNIECKKELTIDGKKELIDYGQNLENELIEYYSNALVQEYGIEINKIDGLSDNIEMVMKLKDKLDEGLDSLVFESDAIKLLNAAQLKDLIEKNDNLAIENYIKEKNDILNAKGQLEQKQLDTLNKELNDKSRLQICYLNGKQYIKYIDKSDKVHLIETKDPLIISKAYKEGLKTYVSSNNLDVDDFFQNLKDINDEIELKTLKEKDLDNATSQEIDMLDFVHSNKKIQEKANDQEITHSEDSTIHVIEATNEIVTTQKNEVKDDVKSKIIANDITGLKENGSSEFTQEVTNNDEIIISDEEAKKLYEKFANNEKLSLAELRALRNYEKKRQEMGEKTVLSADEIAQMQIDNLKQLQSYEKGPKLVPKYYGFVRGFLMMYIMLASGAIGLSIGALISRLIIR
jgi:hypothetical protein